MNLSSQGLTEDYSLGDSHSVALSKLFLGGSGEDSMHVIWGWGHWEIHVVKHVFWLKITSNNKEQRSQVNNFSAVL